MLINLEKSTLYINGVDDGTTGSICRILSILLKYWEGGLIYLGYSLKSNRYIQ
jgi:hypothetical protein